MGNPEIDAAFGGSQPASTPPSVAANPEIESAFGPQSSFAPPVTSGWSKQLIPGGLPPGLERQIGLGTRNVIEGAAGPITGLIDAGIGDVRMAMHPFSPVVKSSPATDWLDNQLTKAGLPVASSPMERNVSAVEQFGAALMTGKGGRESEPPMSPEQIAQRSASSQSMGAAGSAPDLSNAPPSLRQAVIDAAQKTGGAVNSQALVNHAEAASHGVDLMEGQATRDPTAFSNEQNSTNPAIMKRRADQEQQMTGALDDIRQKAGPTTVSNDPIQNGQQVVDALKTYDKPVKADIDQSYDAARKASANGDLQMDGSSFVSDANAALKPQSKSRFLPSTVKGILNDVESNDGKMSLDDYQAYQTQLGNEIAKAQASQDGNAANAIGKVKSVLDQVQPMGDETTQAKSLFDVARAKAKARFDALDADPAYEAAVNDPTKVGSPSPLADKFLDKYALGAPKANLDLMMDKLDPESQQAVASHTLSAIRNSAITPNGKVSPNGYNGAIQKYGPKLNSLVGPDTVDSLDSLGRVITNAKVPPEGHFVNYSKSGVLRNAATGVAQEIGGAALNAKTFGMGVPIVRGIAERSFAKRVLAPGAGLSKLSDLVNPTQPKP
jgi:hypothetical protein